MALRPLTSYSQSALAHLREQRRRLAEELSRLDAAIQALEGRREPSAVAHGTARGTRQERLGRVVDRFDMYGLPRRIYEAPYRALLDEFKGQKAPVGKAVEFLASNFGLSPLTARAYVEYALRRRSAAKAGRGVEFR